MSPRTMSWWSSSVYVALLSTLLFGSRFCSAEGAQRVKLAPFTVAIQPLDAALTSSEATVLQYEIEEVLADYFQDENLWPEGTEATYVGLAHILSNTFQDGTARVTMDGLVYFSDTSEQIPSESEMLALAKEALTSDVIRDTLHPLFPGIEVAELEPYETSPPTRRPTPSPTPAPTTSAPSPAPQAITGVATGDHASFSSSSNVGTIIGSVAGGFFAVLAAGLLFVQRQRGKQEISEGEWEISKPNNKQRKYRLEDENHSSATGTSPAKTVASSLADEERAASTVYTNKTSTDELDRELKRHQNVGTTMNRVGSSTEDDSYLDYNIDEMHSDLEWDNSSEWQHNGALRIVESFEQQKRQQNVRSLKKDMLQSPGLSATSYNPAQLAGGEERHRCALTPTDVSAATLAMQSRDCDSDDENQAKNVKPKPESSITMSMGSFLPQFAFWWGSQTPTPKNLLSSEDEDTFGNEVRSDWDPDDTSQSDDLPSNSDLFDAHVESKDEQTLLHHSLKNESYRMQRLRTPPPVYSKRVSHSRFPDPVRHMGHDGDSSDDDYSSSVFAL